MTKSPAAEPRRSFDGVAEIYHGIRPSYPAPMFEDLFRLLPSSPAILEVGPGTGQATRHLLQHHDNDSDLLWIRVTGPTQIEIVARTLAIG